MLGDQNVIEHCLVTKHFLVWTLFDGVWPPIISHLDRAYSISLSVQCTFCDGFTPSCGGNVVGSSKMPAGATSNSSQLPCTIGTGELALSTVGGCSLQLQ